MNSIMLLNAINYLQELDISIDLIINPYPTINYQALCSKIDICVNVLCGEGDKNLSPTPCYCEKCAFNKRESGRCIRNMLILNRGNAKIQDFKTLEEREQINQKLLECITIIQNEAKVKE